MSKSEKPNLADFKERLNNALRIVGVQGQELAAMLGGMDPGTVSGWRTGSGKPPSERRRRKIEEVLGIPRKWLDGEGPRDRLKQLNFTAPKRSSGDADKGPPYRAENDFRQDVMTYLRGIDAKMDELISLQGELAAMRLGEKAATKPPKPGIADRG